MISHIDLKKYFTLPTKSNSHLANGFFPFIFVNKNSKKLLVTIGDSWTWGDELQKRNLECFGNVLSDQLNSDWLNLSVPGASNNFISQLFKDFVAYIDKTNSYENILCIVVLTETGRDFNGWFDRTVDYASWLRHNISQSKDYDKFFEYINDFSVNDLVQDHAIKNLELLVGFNFVDASLTEKLAHRLIPKTWLEVCLNKDIKESCYAISSFIFEKLDSVLDMEWTMDATQLKQWQLLQIEKAQRRRTLLKDPALFHPRAHPNTQAHKIWAEYLFTYLKNEQFNICN